eukprot:6324007-Alexandrium_andersonii.AAC.1
MVTHRRPSGVRMFRFAPHSGRVPSDRCPRVPRVFSPQGLRANRAGGRRGPQASGEMGVRSPPRAL